MIKRTLGGDRLGSGKKQQVEMHGYERSTHDLSYVWRSTMSAGTLVPFMSELALPGDDFDIDLTCNVLTHPTLGPLFGSYKVQLDVFQAPIRLYQGQLHNNKLGIGMDMSKIKLPVMPLYAQPVILNELPDDIDNIQINPSTLIAYLGVRGVGIVAENVLDDIQKRTFNGIPLLAYWDIYKNYYANKQEELAHFIFSATPAWAETIVSITINGTLIPAAPTPEVVTTLQSPNDQIVIVWASPVPAWAIMIQTQFGPLSLDNIGIVTGDGVTSPVTYLYRVQSGHGQVLQIMGWRYITPGEIPQKQIGTQPFELANIDKMREQILQATTDPTPFDIEAIAITEVGDPYQSILQWTNEQSPYMSSQNGLAIKTYQSDLLNNWLSTEWIDGVDGITQVTRVTTADGYFTIDELNLHKKVYEMLNRIAVSGGSYDDWLDAVYDHDRITRAETPIYHGGLIKELVFQEVVSNAQSTNPDQTQPQQPLGTLAGKGVMANKNKGGRMTIKVDEPSYIMGIVSLTPRIDYSQGNKWDMGLMTMDDLHKPALDEIGFQELITEQMAWFDTHIDVDGNWIQKSAGKQPAWTNYMTNINRVRGNFAIQENEMFMTLNRRYQHVDGSLDDVTTYIDPAKYNFIFAATALDNQNFWTQIAVNINARRKLSAKIMPNL